LTGCKIGAVKGKRMRERQELSIVRGQARTGEGHGHQRMKRVFKNCLTSVDKSFQGFPTVAAEIFGCMANVQLLM
jgi:hypothetical protein